MICPNGVHNREVPMYTHLKFEKANKGTIVMLWTTSEMRIPLCSDLLS